ncbi:MAG: hypothetical protein KKG00_03155 [Bacteroidetes bacterium]|nr:hypothetical protein [Bacteroidota bacterium]
MKKTKKMLGMGLVWAIVLFGGALLSSCEKTESINGVDTQVVGAWKLDAITYGLTQMRVQGDKLPYTETLTYSANGDYTITRDSKEVETGKMYTGKNNTGLAFKEAIFYKKDTTYQAYELREGRLFLYQRADQGAVVADGSTYEYKRQ